MKKSTKTAKPQAPGKTPAATSGATKLAKPGTMDALKTRVMAIPEARQAYLEAKSNVKIAQLIGDMRTCAGLTQKEVADQARMSEPNVMRIEQGDGVCDASIGLMSRMASACGAQLVVGYVSKNPGNTPLRSGKDTGVSRPIRPVGPERPGVNIRESAVSNVSPESSRSTAAETGEPLHVKQRILHIAAEGGSVEAVFRFVEL